MQKHFFILTISILFFSACEKDIELELPEPEEKVVVEGYVENNAPPYVILTKNISLSAGLDFEQLENLFVKDATITVSNGQQTVTLEEFSSADLPPQLIEQLDVEIPEGFNFTFYTTFQMVGEIGKSYELNITTPGHSITAVTTITDTLPLDSIWIEPSKISEKKDSLGLIYVRYDDPAGETNFARYFTSRNDEPFFPNYFQSVFDDNFIDGETIDFVLERGQSRSDTLNFDTYGYFQEGDTISIRWCAIDAAHYDFWRTVEQQQSTGDNPFSSPTLITSNVKGGLGIWGGYSCIYYEGIVVPEF